MKAGVVSGVRGRESRGDGRGRAGGWSVDGGGEGGGAVEAARAATDEKKTFLRERDAFPDAVAETRDEKNRPPRARRTTAAASDRVGSRSIDPRAVAGRLGRAARRRPVASAVVPAASGPGAFRLGDRGARTWMVGPSARVGVRDAELDDVRAGVVEDLERLGGGAEVGVARADEGHERALPARLEVRERVADARRLHRLRGRGGAEATDRAGRAARGAARGP